MITDCSYEVTFPPAKNPNLTKRKRKGKALNKNDSKVNKKEETSIPAIQCMAPLPEQPQLSVSEEYEKAVTDLLEELDMPQPLPLPNTTAVMWCPIHDTVMQFRTSKNGWCFLKCEVHDCWLFASQTEAPPYMEAARHQLHPELKQQFPVLTCDCDYPAKPVLKVSKSIKNPGRMFLNCNNKIKCNFFQWADLLLSTRNRDSLERKMLQQLVRNDYQLQQVQQPDPSVNAKQQLFTS